MLVGMNLAQIRAARVRQYVPGARVGGYDFSCFDGASKIKEKIQAQTLARIAQHLNDNYSGTSPLEHKKLYTDLTGDIRAKLTTGILFKFLNDLGLDGEVSCAGLGKTNVALEIIKSMSKTGSPDYVTWPEYLNAMFRVGPAADPPTPDPTSPKKTPEAKPGEPTPEAKPGESEPAVVEPVSYKTLDDLTDVAERGIRRIMDFVTLEQGELSEDNVDWVWKDYGAEYKCLKKSALAIIISNMAEEGLGDRDGTGHVYWHSWTNDYNPDVDAVLARFDLDKAGCLSVSEFMAALKSIEKPRKIGILEKMGLRPIGQEEQVRPPPKPFKFDKPIQDISPAAKAGLAVGTPAVMGGLLALKYGWLGFATGGALGLAGVGAAAWTLHRIKSRTEIKGKLVDKKLVDLKDVKEQPMADNLVASKAPEMTAEIYPVHMNILAGQLEAAGYLKAAKQASALAASPKVSGPPEPNPEPTSQIAPSSPRQAPPPTGPTGVMPSGTRSPVQTFRAEAAPFVSVPQVKTDAPILVRRDRRGRLVPTSRMPSKVVTSKLWPEPGSICEDAIKKLPPEVKCIVDAAIASPGDAGLRHAASVLKDPFYEDKYKFVQDCLSARADQIARGKT